VTCCSSAKRLDPGQGPGRISTSTSQPALVFWDAVGAPTNTVAASWTGDGSDAFHAGAHGTRIAFSPRLLMPCLIAGLIFSRDIPNRSTTMASRKQNRTRKESPDGKELLVLELQEIHSAESQLARTLPRLAKAVDSEELHNSMEERLSQGERLITEIEKRTG
jgi:hypothetical protein